LGNELVEESTVGERTYSDPLFVSRTIGIKDSFTAGGVHAITEARGGDSEGVARKVRGAGPLSRARIVNVRLGGRSPLFGHTSDDHEVLSYSCDGEGAPLERS